MRYSPIRLLKDQFAVLVAMMCTALFIGACDTDAITSGTIVVPIDTVTVTVVERDTVFVRSTDTLRTTDTLVVHDTTLVTDTLIVTDTVVVEVGGPPIRETLTFDLEDLYIGDSDHRTQALGTFTVPAFAEVWVEVELSGNSQKDEAWGLRADGVEVVQGDCPVVPDHPFLGDGWEFVGYAAAGTFEFEARHAVLYNCYPPTNNFSSANSVHFERIRFIFYQ